MVQNSAAVKQKIAILDDRELVLDRILDVLKQQYSEAAFFTAKVAQMALNIVENHQPDLLVMDLSIPETTETAARTNTGIQLLKTLLKKYPTLNIVVQSTYVKALVRIKPEIDAHKGGFTIADKSLSSKDMLTRVDWALQGLTHTKDIKSMQAALELKPEWLTLLTLAFQEGLPDKAIAEQMCVSECMVRHYWTKVQDVLDVYPDDDKNIRIQTEMRARKEGLIE